MTALPSNLMSVDDYFAFEEYSAIKHIYYRGEIYAMTGASERHNLIVANVIAALHSQLRKKPCRIYPSDLRVQIEATRHFTYPDISVVCGEVAFFPGRNDTITNPIVLIEVLSPSTEDYDRGKKFAQYRTLASLREYLLISQDRAFVEHYVRQDEHRWLLVELYALDQRVLLSSIDCSLSLDDIYEKVDLPAEDN